MIGWIGLGLWMHFAGVRGYALGEQAQVVVVRSLEPCEPPLLTLFEKDSLLELAKIRVRLDEIEHRLEARPAGGYDPGAAKVSRQYQAFVDLIHEQALRATCRAWRDEGRQLPSECKGVI